MAACSASLHLAASHSVAKLSSSHAPFDRRHGSLPLRARHGRPRGTCWASAERDPLGSMGARDPFPGEIGSGFGEKPLGMADTEHRILLPANVREITGLAQYSCQTSGEAPPMLSFDDAKALLRKVVGWKLAEVDGTIRLRGEWKMKDFVSGLELFKRISEVAEKENHHPDLHLEGWNRATVDLYSHSTGGVTMNDFILAAKIDLIDTRDLVKKTRAWA